jgi:hypothetical protein
MDKGIFPERRFVLATVFFNNWESRKWDVVVKEA